MLTANAFHTHSARLQKYILAASEGMRVYFWTPSFRRVRVASYSCLPKYLMAKYPKQCQVWVITIKENKCNVYAKDLAALTAFSIVHFMRSNKRSTERRCRMAGMSSCEKASGERIANEWEAI